MASWTPVDAPDGTAALPKEPLFVKTSTYIVPLPSIINTEVDENIVTEITQAEIESMVTDK